MLKPQVSDETFVDLFVEPRINNFTAKKFYAHGRSIKLEGMNSQKEFIKKFYAHGRSIKL